MNRLAELHAWADDRGIAAIKEPVIVIAQTSPSALSPVVNNSDIRVDVITPPTRVSDAFTAGQEYADRLIDAGTNLIAVAGDDHLAAMAAIGVLTKSDAAAVLGLPTTGSDESWMNTCAQIRDRMRTIRPEVGEPDEFLTALDSSSLAYLTGLLTRASERETVALIDGLAATAAALIVRRMNSAADRWWLMAHREDHAAFDLAVDRLDIQPLIDVQLRDAPGVAAILALPIVHAALLG
jgi:nicotinate-nucleotide--dimethylbenzimidazole phosphoribosyltransferase